MPSIGGPEVLLCLSLPTALLIYFIPTIVALRAKKRAAPLIFAINVGLGWTIIGWIAVLVWAVVGEREASLGD